MIYGDGGGRELCSTWPSDALPLCQFLCRVSTVFCTVENRGVCWKGDPGQSCSWSEPVGGAGAWKQRLTTEKIEPMLCFEARISVGLDEEYG